MLNDADLNDPDRSFPLPPPRDDRLLDGPTARIVAEVRDEMLDLAPPHDSHVESVGVPPADGSHRPGRPVRGPTSPRSRVETRGAPKPNRPTHRTATTAAVRSQVDADPCSWP
jgi:hypothetical protein